MSGAPWNWKLFYWLSFSIPNISCKSKFRNNCQVHRTTYWILGYISVCKNKMTGWRYFAIEKKKKCQGNFLHNISETQYFFYSLSAAVSIPTSFSWISVRVFRKFPCRKTLLHGLKKQIWESVKKVVSQRHSSWRHAVLGLNIISFLIFICSCFTPAAGGINLGYHQKA